MTSRLELYERIGYLLAGTLFGCAMWMKLSPESLSSALLTLSAIPWITLSLTLLAEILRFSMRDWRAYFFVPAACVLLSEGLVRLLHFLIGGHAFLSIDSDSQVYALLFFAKLEEALVSSCFLLPLSRRIAYKNAPVGPASICAVIGLVYLAYFILLPN